MPRAHPRPGCPLADIRPLVLDDEALASATRILVVVGTAMAQAEPGEVVARLLPDLPGPGDGRDIPSMHLQQRAHRELVRRLDLARNTHGVMPAIRLPTERQVPPRCDLAHLLSAYALHPRPQPVEPPVSELEDGVLAVDLDEASDLAAWGHALSKRPAARLALRMGGEVVLGTGTLTHGPGSAARSTSPRWYQGAHGPR